MATKAFADAFLDQRRRGYDDDQSPPTHDGIRMGYFIEAFGNSAGRYHDIVQNVDFTDPVRSTTALAAYQTATSFQGLFQSSQVAFEDVRDLAHRSCAEHRGKPLDQSVVIAEQQAQAEAKASAFAIAAANSDMYTEPCLHMGELINAVVNAWPDKRAMAAILERLVDHPEVVAELNAATITTLDESNGEHSGGPLDDSCGHTY